jgi:hypothetical protein
MMQELLSAELATVGSPARLDAGPPGVGRTLPAVLGAARRCIAFVHATARHALGDLTASVEVAALVETTPKGLPAELMAAFAAGRIARAQTVFNAGAQEMSGPFTASVSVAAGVDATLSERTRLFAAVVATVSEMFATSLEQGQGASAASRLVDSLVDASREGLVSPSFTRTGCVVLGEGEKRRCRHQHREGESAHPSGRNGEQSHGTVLSCPPPAGFAWRLLFSLDVRRDVKSLGRIKERERRPESAFSRVDDFNSAQEIARAAQVRSRPA